MQHPDAGPLHAGPRGQAEIQTVLEGTLADRHASPELRAGDGRESVLPVQHRVPSAGLQRLRGSGDETSLDLRAGQSGIPIPSVQRRGFPVVVLLGDGRAPGARHRLEKGRAHGPFLRFRYAYADALRLGARCRHARHPHLHLRAVLAAGPLRAHPRRARSRQQGRRRVTPLQSLAQSDGSLGSHRASPISRFVAFVLLVVVVVVVQGPSCSELRYVHHAVVRRGLIDFHCLRNNDKTVYDSLLTIFVSLDIDEGTFEGDADIYSCVQLYSRSVKKSAK